MSAQREKWLKVKGDAAAKSPVQESTPLQPAALYKQLLPAARLEVTGRLEGNRSVGKEQVGWTGTGRLEGTGR